MSLIDNALIINSTNDVPYVVKQFLAGNILLLRLGEVYTFILNPQIKGLADDLNRLKGRTDDQHLSAVCSYDFMLNFVDRERVNPDFYDVGEILSGKALVRIPVDVEKNIPFPCNREHESVQFLNFFLFHPLLGSFQAEIERQGCLFALATSGNIHGAPTCVTLDEAKELANVLNAKARDLSMDNVQIIVVDIPSFHKEFKGSYPIVSFENQSAIEVLRFIKGGPDVTYQYLMTHLEGKKNNTELILK